MHRVYHILMPLSLTNGYIVRVLITGKSGQLAQELKQTGAPEIELLLAGRKEIDVSCRNSIEELVTDYQPNVIINTAAYTQVDNAESEAEKAFAVNRDGALFLAQICQSRGIRLIHVSTDFVFDGKRKSPYEEGDKTNPLGVYGHSKLAGEEAITEHCQNYTIVRTAWVYSSYADNFVKTMLELMADRETLSIVSDQVGTPTWAKGLATWIWSVVENDDVKGIFHWTDDGIASWYDFACSIQDLSVEKGLLLDPIELTPILTEEYPKPAKRPAFSVLDKSKAEKVSGVRAIHWKSQLSEMLDELKLLKQTD